MTTTTTTPSSKRTSWDESLGLSAVDYYLDRVNKRQIDKYFGIQREGENSDDLMMGNQHVEVDKESNIHLLEDGANFKATRGLWALIMQAVPSEYTDDDLEKYKEIVDGTSVMKIPSYGRK